MTVLANIRDYELVKGTVLDKFFVESTKKKPENRNKHKTQHRGTQKRIYDIRPGGKRHFRKLSGWKMNVRELSVKACIGTLRARIRISCIKLPPQQSAFLLRSRAACRFAKR